MIKRPFSFSSIKSKLILSFMLLTIFTLILMSSFVSIFVYNQTKNAYMESVNQQIKLVDIGIEHYIANIANNTRMLAKLPIMVEGADHITSYVNKTSADGRVPMEPLMGSDYEIDVFSVLDSFQNAHISVQNASLGGELNGGFVKSPPSPRFNNYDARNRVWYQSAVENIGDVYLSEMYLTSSDEHVIYSVMAVTDQNGTLKGVISLDINLTDLSEMISEIKFGASGYVVLADSKGNIIAHPKASEFVGQPINSLWGNKVIDNISYENADEIEFEIELADKNNYWIKINRSEIPYFPLQYIVIIEKSAFSESAYDLLRQLFILTGLLVFVSLIIAFLLSSKIATPILHLGNITKAFSEGKLGIRATVDTNDEIEELAFQFNEMASKIEYGKALLEKEVYDRTKELSEANEALKYYNDELLQTLDALKAAQLQLIHSEKLAGLGNMVAGVAHEINTPIGITITAVTHLHDVYNTFSSKYENGGIKRTELEEYLKLSGETLDIALKNLERAKLLIFNFKQVSADQASEIKRSINLNDYIKSVLISLRPKLKNTNLAVDVNCPEEIDLTTYPGAIAQIITNLIQNSINHAYEPLQEGNISIKVEEAHGFIRFIYEDDGRGMPESVSARIFEPFYTTKRDQGGTGLGLHVVYNLVTLQLRGDIKCLSSLNNGTQFIIRFPMEKTQGGSYE